MILEDMVYELWEQLGRPMKEDLDPTAGGLGAVDATSAGCRRLAKVLDWAQVQVAAWKDPRQGGRPFWWSGAFRTFVKKGGAYTMGPGQATDGFVAPTAVITGKTEKIINGGFESGSTGWTLGAGARVRQQGWVAKIISSDGATQRRLISNYSPAIQNEQFTAIIWVKTDGLHSASLNARIRYSLTPSGGTVESDDITIPANTTNWTKFEWTGTLNSASANTVCLDFTDLTNSSGTLFVGFALLYRTATGEILTQNYDFADGFTAWTTSGGTGESVTIAYDPANAYLGNSPDGTARNVLVQDTSGSDAAWQVINCQPGEVYQYALSRKWLSGTGAHNVYVQYWSGPDRTGTMLSAGGISAKNSTTGWESDTGTITIPAGCQSIFFDVEGSGVFPGLWLVGEVSVKKLEYTYVAAQGNNSQIRNSGVFSGSWVGGVARVGAMTYQEGDATLVVAEEDREIVLQNGTDLIVYPALTADSSEREITLCPRWVDLERTWRARNVHKVSIMGTGGAMTELVRASRGDQMMQEATVGEPGAWVLKGSRVWLDVALAEERWFKLECEVAPADLVVVADAITGALDLAVECELPEQFHPLVVLYASAYGQGLLQDVEQQEVRRGQFRNDMMSAVDQAETLLDMDQGLTINVVPR